jgi:Zn-dependent M28 family amino/carboxypeptidase
VAVLSAALFLNPVVPVPIAGASMDLPSYLRAVVTTLARDIGIRTYRHTDRLASAERFISDELTSFGYLVTKQTFTYDGLPLQNIIAEQKGARAPERVLVVGAHYDTVRTTPGADDNASGVAGLLGIARALAGKSLDRTVRFVAFAFEEPPAYRTKSMGSYQYARHLQDGGEQAEGMVCLEMIGYFNDRQGSQHYPFPFMNRKFPKTGNYLALVGNRRSEKFTTAMAAAFRTATDLPVITLNAPAIVVGIDFSDHWSFNKFGVPSFMVTDTAFYRNPHYHAPTDLPETLDYLRMAKAIDGLAAAVEKWGRGLIDDGQQ